MNKWSFRKIAAIEEPVFNNTLERFYNLGQEGLVRENIQNALDAKISKLLDPVKVIIKTGEVDYSVIPGIEEIFNHIDHLKGENEYTRETIQHMKHSMKKEKISYISFEDCNTKGLTGAEHGEKIQQGDTWGAYAYKKGVHFTDEDEEFERSRGGSHGVGKIACNAASDLHMMFFSNCDEFGKCHIGGTVQLIEHSIGQEKYRATGYFTKVIDNVYYPFENSFNHIFQKNTRGLKIIIPYLREQYRDEGAIVRAVCDNFWMAILGKTLVVEVNDVEINHETILGIVKDPNIYEEQDFFNIKTNFTPLYISTYCEKKPVKISIFDKKKEYFFSLYLSYNEEIKKGRMAIVRGIGMKIEDIKITSYVNAPFNAVLVPMTSNEDIFLKSLENESHTQLAFEHIKDPETQANAKRFINNITREMQKIISELLKEAHPSDGVIDTSDVIYSIETSFRKELSKDVSTVQLTKGSKENEKTIVKVKTKKSYGKKQKREKQEKKGIRNIIRRVLKKETGIEEHQRVRYSMQPEAVKRIVLKNKEILKFDFTEIEQYAGEKICDISFSVIDGTGKAYESEFDIKTGYYSVIDKNIGRACKIEGNIIKDVTINEGKVNMEMSIADKFNKSLKFMYYVEV